VESVTKTFTLKGVQTIHRSTPFSVNVFVTLVIQQHLEYHCNAHVESPCIVAAAAVKRGTAFLEASMSSCSSVSVDVDDENSI
jgi:hypothetical protein